MSLPGDSPRAPRTTRRADRRALVEAGKRWHDAKLAYQGSGIEDDSAAFKEYQDAFRALIHAGEVYAVGRKKASIEFAQRHYRTARTKRQEGK